MSGAGRISTLVTVLVAAVLATCCAQLTYEGMPGPVPAVTVLQNDGFASDAVTFLLESNDTLTQVNVTVVDPNIITNYSITQMVSSPGLYNITVVFDFEGGVGESDYTVTATTDSTSGATSNYEIGGTYRVAGIVIRDADGNIVSGTANMLTLGTFIEIQLNNGGKYEFTVDSVPVDPATPIDFAMTQFSIRSPSGDVSNVISWDSAICSPLTDDAGTLAPGCGVGFDPTGTKFYVQFNPLQVGSGMLSIDFVNPSLVDPATSESFQGTLPIVTDATLRPPPVMFAIANLVTDYYGGEIWSFQCDNMPFNDTLTALILTVGSATWSLDSAETGTLDLSSGSAIVVLATQSYSARRLALLQRQENVTASLPIFTFSILGETRGQLVDSSGQNPLMSFPVEYGSPDLAAPSTVPNGTDLGLLSASMNFAPYSLDTFSQFKSDQIVRSIANAVGVPSSQIALTSTAPCSSARRTQIEYPWLNAASNRQSSCVLVSYDVAGNSSDLAALATAMESHITSGQLARDVHVRGSGVSLAGPIAINGVTPTPSPTATPTVSPTPTASPLPTPSPSPLATTTLAPIANATFTPSTIPGQGSTPTPSPSSTSGGGGFPTGAIIGLSILGGIIGLLLLACCLWFVLFRRDREDDASTEPSFTVDGPATVPVPVEYPVVRDAFGRGHYEQELGAGEVDQNAGLPVEQPRPNSTL
mmetsp:Transcript_3911/g.7506  ORF Transcript_3911/g.7506 Transcript_3911/m.7506 type:complete len:702 (-) Transcript_3911:3941-6046(-)